MKIREDMNEFVASTTIPHMFVFGMKDFYISWEVAEGLMAKFPKAEALVLENSGHMGFVEEPKKSLEAIVAFAEKSA